MNHLKTLAMWALYCAVVGQFVDPSLVPVDVDLAVFVIDDIIVYIVIAVIIAALATSVTLALTAKVDIEDQESSGLGDYGFPTNLESRYIPVVWGSTRVDGPNVIWYGDFRTFPLTTGGGIVGYFYYLGIDSAICWGEVDSITAVQLGDEFLLKAGDQKTLASGVAMPSGGFVKTSSGHRRIHVTDYNFTGGTKRGGGVDSDISFYYGTQDQPINEYQVGVEQRVGTTTTLADATVVPTWQLIPSYAGVCHMMWEGGYLTESATAPQFKIHLQRFPTGLSSAFSQVSSDGTLAEANPAHVIYEILTDENWGLGIDPTSVDKASFLASAEQCHGEGLGYSRTITDAKQAKGAIDDICSQANGLLTQSRDGLFQFKLNRETYRTSDNQVLDYDGVAVTGEFIPTLTPDTIIKVKSASRNSWEETFNVVHLSYLDRNQEFRSTVANAVDSGNIAIRKGVQAIKKVQMDGIRNSDTAALVAQRLLQGYAFPLTSLSMDVSRVYSYLRPGDVIEVNHPDFGLNDFYMRVLEVGLPQDTSGNVLITGTQDIFGDKASPVQVGGSTSYDVIEGIEPVAVAPATGDLSGLPVFIHQQLGLSTSEAHTWHLLGSVDTPTVSAQGFQLVTGVYQEVTDTKVLPITGRIVGHVDDLWDPGTVLLQEYDRTSDSSLALGGAYANSPGPHTNPIRHNTNIGNPMLEGYSQDSMRFLSSSGDHVRAGDIWVTDVSSDRDTISGSNFTVGNIQNYGYGLAIVRPAWANGDTRYDEIIGFTSANAVQVLAADYTTQFGAQAPTQHYGSAAPAVSEVIQTHSVLSLTGVYRGLLDTGIQVLNTDSVIQFVQAGDAMYDLVGQNVSSLSAQTYRYNSSSTSGQLLPEDTADYSVTVDELRRHQRPLPPTLISDGASPVKTIWGSNLWSNSAWAAYNPPVLASGLLDFNWSSHDYTSVPGIAKLYSDVDADKVGETVFITIELVDDDRVASWIHRKSHQQAYYKEGWLPTLPVLSHNQVSGGGITENAVFEVTWDGTLNGSPTAAAGTGTIDVTALFAALPSIDRPTLTLNAYYFAIVSVQTKDVSTGYLSRGAQRYGVQFQANANVAP